MRQEHFERQGEARWREFEALLDALERRNAEAPERFPAAYRRICQDLALARDRHFTRDVHERLNRLALRGHRQLYRARPSGRRVLVELFGRDFPRAVRAEWRLLVFVGLLFYGTGLGAIAAIQLDPDLVYAILDPEAAAEMERMYRPGNDRIGAGRDAQTDVAMFGFYVFNNISIAFRTFASGLLAGIGTIVIVGINGLYIGAVFGHLAQVGLGEQIYGFAIAHGAFELTAILIAGVAGMRLGLAWIAPGQRSRADALREAGRVCVPLVYGTGGMLLIAAGIEAFWSPRTFPIAVKYTAGALTWTFVIVYLALAGRRTTVD